ncbi:helix-turn-helix transcriptional regulator [Fibrobacter sp. UWB13]|uniref:helix-turn-helix transcriptional regulator n=1 Tax=Fibrobacter sp. UWB13 TaxID=1896204 RepID=UPI000A0CBCDF|nr:helix-turn-helix transcriptional regulator [Fibrobacter sp. UWB13]SMG34796.1 DNA-binding transcriptional regulator, XRE-family HTH domain [Fibrobacter sp. UWB13]
MDLTEISSLGKLIAERRKELNISQADLAEMSGVSLRTVNGIESGRANPSVKVLFAILQVLGFVITLKERVVHE